MTASSVDEYLAALPADQREALATIRAAIQKKAPDAVESIAYGMPAYKYRGKPLIYFGAAKGHIALYGSNVRLLPEEQRVGLDHSKGTIRFRPDAPLPAGVLDTILHARMAEIDTD